MSARDFLFELGCEELPPLALPELERALAAGIRAGLETAGVPHGEIRSFAAPRRLAVSIEALAENQPDQRLKRRGPPLNAAFDKQGAPTRAATAFAFGLSAALRAPTDLRNRNRRPSVGACAHRYGRVAPPVCKLV